MAESGFGVLSPKRGSNQSSLEGLLCLEVLGPGSYVPAMKRIPVFFAAMMLMAPGALRAQDAALQERLDKISAQIEDLIAAKEAQNKRIDDLAKAVSDLQSQQQNKPVVDYATRDDLKQLADKFQEVRSQDNDRFLKQLDEIAKTVSGLAKAATSAKSSSGNGASSGITGTGVEYEIREGDNPSAIAKAYTQQGMKVTADQIIKANPGLDPRNLRIGQKILIPVTPK